MILNFIKGIIIGLALVVPGLSGSSFAVVVGIYDKIIFAVNNLRKQFKKSFLYLLPIAIGAAIGVLASASFVLFLMENFPMQSYAFFIGLVIGSLPTIYMKMQVKAAKNSNYILLILGLAIISTVTFFTPSSEGIVAIYTIQSMGDFIQILTAGVIACFLLAVPGVSGSVVLMLLGQFGTVYNAVSSFADVLLMAIGGQAGAFALGVSSLAIVLTFLLGAIIGIIAAAKIIGYLIERYEHSIYFLVMGLIIGTIYTLFDTGIQYSLTNYMRYNYNILVAILSIVSILIFIVFGYICTKFMAKEKGA